MLTGPGEREGWPGKQDGRIDALLDTGTYKVRAFGDPAATGDTTLSVTPFAAAGPALLAPGYLPVALTLRDLQSRSFWLVVGDDPAPTRIEAAGRSLAALTVWRDGRDLVSVPRDHRHHRRDPGTPDDRHRAVRRTCRPAPTWSPPMAGRNCPGPTASPTSHSTCAPDALPTCWPAA